MSKPLYFLLFLFSSIVFSQKATQSIEVKEYILKNGLTVMLSENSESSNIYGVVAVKAGGKNDPKDATGIAHYLEHVLFKGTQELGTTDYESERVYLDSISKLYEKLSKTSLEEKRYAIQKEINRISIKASQYAIPNELDKLLKQMGGLDINAFTNEDYTAYYNSFPPNQINRWLEIYSHRFQNPVFRLFQSELETVYEEKNISMDDPFENVFEEVAKHVYKKHPYGQQTILGKVEHLKNPSLQKMYDFFNTYYVANNMVLALSGDFNSEMVIPLIEQTFGKLRSGKIPDFPEFKEEPFNKRELVEKKLTPIKLGAIVFRSPREGDKDNLTFEMALETLYNYEETGYLNKLRDEGKLMEAGLFEIGNIDYGATAVYFIPKLIGQKLDAAEKIILEQIERLKKGEFSDQYVEALKINKLKEISYNWESNESRALEMVEAFMQEKKWKDYYENYEMIENINKEAIVQVANKYFGDNYLCFYSKMGSPKKEKLDKPGYKPQVSNTNSSSSYSKKLLEIEPFQYQAKYVDYDTDTEKANLGDNISIIKTKNPFNNVFDLKIKFGIGIYKIPEIRFLGNYLSLLGTDKYSVGELKEAFHQLGSTYYFNATENNVSLIVSGIESNLEKILVLTEELINNLVFDEVKVSQAVEEFKTQRKLNLEQPIFLAQTLNEYALLGNKAPRLRELTKKEIKKLKAERLKNAYNSILNYEKTIHFVGNTGLSQLKLLCDKYLNTEKKLKDKEPFVIFDRQKPSKNKIYILNNKKSIQSHIVFNIEGSERSNSKANYSNAFNSYFGSDMSSIVFQEIREFRSLAYSTFAQYSLAPMEGENNSFIGYVGCQADKTIESVKVMNDLILNMPEKPERLEMIKSSLIESSKTSKPSFRNLIERIESWKRQGFDDDPNKLLLEQYNNLSFKSIVDFYKAEIQNKPMIITIVGDVSRFNLEELKRYGEIIMVKKSDLFIN